MDYLPLFWLSSKESACQVGDPGLTSWVRKIRWRRDRLSTLVFLASLVAQLVKNMPAMPETWVPSLGWEDPLEKEMATHSSILAWKIPWAEELGRLQSMGSQRVGGDRAPNIHNGI